MIDIEFNLIRENADFSRIERMRRIADLDVESSNIAGQYAIQSEAEQARGFQDALMALQRELAQIQSDLDKRSLISEKAQDAALEFNVIMAQWRSGFLDSVSLAAHRAKLLDGRQIDLALTESARHHSVDYMRGVYKALTGVVFVLNADEDPAMRERTGIFFREKHVVFQVGPFSFRRLSKFIGHFIGQNEEEFREAAKARGVDVKIVDIIVGTIEEIKRAYNQRLSASLEKH